MIRTNRLSEEEGGKVKPSGYVHEYTEEQARELLLCSFDPIYFIENYVYIQHPVHGRIKFQLYDFQRNLLKVYNDTSKCIAMLSRQCGKCNFATTLITKDNYETSIENLLELSFKERVVLWLEKIKVGLALYVKKKSLVID